MAAVIRPIIQNRRAKANRSILHRFMRPPDWVKPLYVGLGALRFHATSLGLHANVGDIGICRVCPVRHPIAAAGSLGREALISSADRFAANLLPLVRAIQSTGAVTLEAISCALNERGVRPARGARWYASSVANLLSRAQKIAAARTDTVAGLTNFLYTGNSLGGEPRPPVTIAANFPGLQGPAAFAIGCSAVFSRYGCA